ncbi:hypothetical protein A2U01_0062226, partial [Trifolium medium]|nr:hypothetical protein [Trifolium medium]
MDLRLVIDGYVDASENGFNSSTEM